MTLSIARPTVEQARVSSPWGWRWLHRRWDYHTGVDYAAPAGTPVFSVLPGIVHRVYQTGQMYLYGNTVIVRYQDPELTRLFPGKLYGLYAHMDSIIVDPGEVLEAGDMIGTVGTTAGTREEPDRRFRESGAHLHFEFLDRWPPEGKDRNRIDPQLVFDALSAQTPVPAPLAEPETQPSAAPKKKDR